MFVWEYTQVDITEHKNKISHNTDLQTIINTLQKLEIISIRPPQTIKNQNIHKRSNNTELI